MIEFHPEIKLVHVGAVIASGSLFTTRGALMLAGSPLANHAAVRYLSYSIDCTLLTAALMLITILHQYPFVNGWLTAKVLLLVVYIVLGSLALKRGRTPSIRAGCYFAALCVYLYIAGIAHAHDPRGVFAMLSS